MRKPDRVPDDGLQAGHVGPEALESTERNRASRRGDPRRGVRRWCEESRRLIKKSQTQLLTILRSLAFEARREDFLPTTEEGSERGHFFARCGRNPGRAVT